MIRTQGKGPSVFPGAHLLSAHRVSLRPAGPWLEEVRLATVSLPHSHRLSSARRASPHSPGQPSWVGGILSQKRKLRFRVAQSFSHGKRRGRKLHPELSGFRACLVSTLQGTLESHHLSSPRRIPLTCLTQKILWGKVGLDKGNVEESLSWVLQNKPPPEESTSSPRKAWR